MDPYNLKLCFRHEDRNAQFPQHEYFSDAIQYYTNDLISSSTSILMQIRQKTAIVSILHNNHILFCFWVLCHSISFKEWKTQTLGVISELLDKNKYSVKLNITLINNTNYYRKLP